MLISFKLAKSENLPQISFIMAELMTSESGTDATEIAKTILEELMLHGINQDLQIVNSEEINPTESTNAILQLSNT